MKTWDIDDKVDAVLEMRMEQVNHAIRTGGAAAGGITVLDYFAAEAMAGLIRHFDFDQFKQDPMRVAAWSYDMAKAMMAERERKQPQTCSVEEAFGL